MSDKTYRSIFAIVFARLAINVTKRFPYPFVSPIGASFGVSADSIQSVIALNNAAGLLSPVLGTVSEHYGKKTVMVGALLVMTILSLVGALFSDYGVFVLVMFGFGVGKIIYDPTFQAYLGDIIHFSRRARVMGIAEAQLGALPGDRGAPSPVSCSMSAQCARSLFFWRFCWR